MEKEIEQELTRKGLNAPRISPAQIDAQIVGEAYYVFPGTTVTVCCLTLRNGYTALGHAASVSADNFDEEIGRKVAHENARRQIWPLEGYLLAERLAMIREKPKAQESEP